MTSHQSGTGVRLNRLRTFKNMEQRPERSALCVVEGCGPGNHRMLRLLLSMLLRSQYACLFLVKYLSIASITLGYLGHFKVK
jgi:hypothetical protein